MNSKDFIQTLRKVIREEVQLAVRTELNKITPVISENKSVSKYTDSIRSTVTPKVYSSNTNKKQFASDITNPLTRKFTPLTRILLLQKLARKCSVVQRKPFRAFNTVIILLCIILIVISQQLISSY